MKPIHIIRRGERVTLANVAPTRTLLEVLREDLGCSAAKEGCGEGDCGACTVVLGELASAADAGKPGSGQSLITGTQPAIRYRAINACIRLAHSVDGMAVWTAQDLADPDGALHPAQQAMVDCHGSQCGFCTPGFVMSLFGMYQNHVCQGRQIDTDLARQDLSGNLCRCTGYRPILDAAQQMASYPPVRVDEQRLREQLLALPRADRADRADHAQTPPAAQPATYTAPTTLAALLRARAEHPQAQLVAGCTDVGLWVTKQHRVYDHVLDVTRVAELRRVEHYPHHIAIGAAVTLADAYDALVALRPQLAAFARRFAGLPVRNSGTLGGNVANGSPIGDSMPLLIALGANVVLMSRTGHREMPLESLYTGYRKNVMRADEVLAWVKVPRPRDGEFMRVYKISKRYDDDISAVCLAVRLTLRDGMVWGASIGAGGVAATPVRAAQTEAALEGQPWNEATVRQAQATLAAEFKPISDMRASAAYRQAMLGALLQRLWLESQGVQGINLESIHHIGEAA